MVNPTHYPDFIQRSPDEGGGAPHDRASDFHGEKDPAVFRGRSTAHKSVVDIFTPQPGDGFSDASEVSTERRHNEFDADWAWDNLPRMSSREEQRALTYLNHFAWTKDLFERVKSKLKPNGDITILPILRSCMSRKVTAEMLEEALRLGVEPEQFEYLLRGDVWFDYLEIEHLQSGASHDQRVAAQLEVIKISFGS